MIFLYIYAHWYKVIYVYTLISKYISTETEQLQKYSLYNKEDTLKLKERRQIALSFQWQ